MILASYKIYNLSEEYKESKRFLVPRLSYFLVTEQEKLASMPACFQPAINLRQLWEAGDGKGPASALPTGFIHIINIKVNFCVFHLRIILGLLMVWKFKYSSPSFSCRA